MMNFRATLIVALAALVASVAFAGTDINGNIGDAGVPNHWTKAGSPYHLRTQVYVLPGETLTIDAGVVVASFVDDQGSIAVCRDAKIYVNGTECEPVIMTSAEDVANWAGSSVVRGGSPDPLGQVGNLVSEITVMGDPKTGVWMERSNDWGNLTIMGKALVSGSSYGGNPIIIDEDDDGVPGGSVTTTTNTACPDGNNKRLMEGLVAGFTGDPKIIYGGNDDDDDSGSISYLSIRYGGRTTALPNQELNGLSLGGVGRGTNIDHVEIMNNVDDGIEIWGGTVQLTYVNIWNIGDDSFDIDQGWRGCAKYGLIVQGYSGDSAKQGSNVGDNMCEHDGAEDSDAQPVTHGKISNFTMVGQPTDGDGATAWRDGARMQYNCCVIMDCGEKVVRPDGDDGDGQSGYGHNGTLAFADIWTTAIADLAANTTVNLCGESIDALYWDYICFYDGYLAQITDTIFWNNADYAEAILRGVLLGSGNSPQDNPAIGNYLASAMPIQGITREAPVVRAGIVMERVSFINPMPAAEAADFCRCAGAFKDYNWLACWTAVDAYGMTDTSMNPKRADITKDGDVDLQDAAELFTGWLL